MLLVFDNLGGNTKVRRSFGKKTTRSHAVSSARATTPGGPTSPSTTNTATTQPRSRAMGGRDARLVQSNGQPNIKSTMIKGAHGAGGQQNNSGINGDSTQLPRPRIATVQASSGKILDSGANSRPTRAATATTTQDFGDKSAAGHGPGSQHDQTTPMTVATASRSNPMTAARQNSSPAKQPHPGEGTAAPNPAASKSASPTLKISTSHAKSATTPVNISRAKRPSGGRLRTITPSVNTSTGMAAAKKAKVNETGAARERQQVVAPTKRPAAASPERKGAATAVVRKTPANNSRSVAGAARRSVSTIATSSLTSTAAVPKRILTDGEQRRHGAPRTAIQPPTARGSSPSPRRNSTREQKRV